jgi:hypothetical protein
MPPPAVLSAYPPAVRDCRWVALPPGGGLNGGRVWRGDLDGEPLFALKQWPTDFTSDRVRAIHDRMRTAAHLNFTPHLVGGPTLHAGHVWDITTWKPGTPDLLARPSLPQLQAAGVAVATLHRTWWPTKIAHAPSSLVARRLQLLAEWDRTRFAFTGPPEVVREVESTLPLVRHRLHPVRAQLLQLAPLRRPAVPVHGDFWPENVLFQQERLSGVIDFGMTTTDHPEVDLGRLLADVPGVDGTGIAAAVDAYNANGPYELSVPLVEALARSGRVCSLANWHLRLTAGSPDAGLGADALPRVRRLAALVAG